MIWILLNQKKRNKANRNSSGDRMFGRSSESSDEDAQIGSYDRIKVLNLSSLAGIINRDEVQRMKRIIFRASRGNALVHTVPIEKSIREYSGIETLKDVYIITFQEGEALRSKLTRIWESFNADSFQLPTEGYHEKLDDVQNKIRETKHLITTTTNEMKLYLSKVWKLDDRILAALGVSRLSLYKTLAEYDRAIYTNLNKFVSKKSLFHGYFWSTMNASDISRRLDFEGHALTELQLEDCFNHNIPPPTHFRTNVFLKPFQDIVDTYGVPVYKEVNPTVFTIVTFPFLFGVMFGDIGHGGIIFMFSVGLWMAGDRLKGSQLETMTDIRYLLLLLGFFATFWGLIYNDFMSLPVELFGSWYNYNEAKDNLKLKEDWVYPFGIDHGWYLAKNELTYFNSLKMKLSVIFGVSQMSLGIFMKAANALYFNQRLDFYFEFIPQILLLWAIFGYMIILIIVKWLTLYQDTSIAPSIIGYMIEMFLNFGSISGDAIIHSQGLNETLHVFLLLLAFFCVPAMLIIKPYVIYKNMHGLK